MTSCPPTNLNTLFHHVQRYNLPCCHWIQIRDYVPRLIFSTTQWIRLESVMDMLAEMYSPEERDVYRVPPDADFFLFSDDRPHALPQELTPVMHFACCVNDTRAISVPLGVVGKCGPETTHELTSPRARLDEWGRMWQQALDVPFEERSDVLYWRGGEASCADQDGGLPSYRIRTIDQVIRRIQVPGIEIKMHWARHEGIVTMVKQNTYKYMMDLRGIGWSSRLQFLFWMGAVVFVLDRDEHEFWFRDNFQPWVHYVPVKYDASDLEEALKKVSAMPDKGKQIADAARAKAKEVLTEANFKHYFAGVLRDFVAKHGLTFTLPN